MVLFNLATSAFLIGFGLAFIKFFLLGILVNDLGGLKEKEWIIQLVGAVITVGPFLVFPIAAPLATALYKRSIMLVLGIVTAILLSIGSLTGWIGTPWFYLVAVGLLMGIFNPAKNATVPLVAVNLNTTTEKVNATLNITYLLGLVAGIPVGTAFQTQSPEVGELVLVTIFLIAGLFGWLCSFKNEAENLITFDKAVKDLYKTSKIVVKKYYTYLFTAPLLWGIASAISLAITSFVEVESIGTSLEASLMSVWAIIGVAIGSIISAWFNSNTRRILLISLSTLIFSILAIPFSMILLDVLLPSGLLGIRYTIITFFTVAIGISFGASTNIIEGEFFRKVFIDRLEGTAVSILSAGTALFPFLLGSLITVLLLVSSSGSPERVFILITLVSLIPLTIIGLSSIATASPGWQKVFSVILKSLLSLRYNISIKDEATLAEILNKQDSGVIILPNHPAEIDPIILLSIFYRYRHISPVMVEDFTSLPGMKYFGKLLNIITVPDVTVDGGAYKQLRATRSIQNVANTLNNNGGVLLYPSGRLMRESRERMYGSSGAYNLIKDLPDNCSVLLVNSKGLYGSMWSMVNPEKGRPDPLKLLIKSIKILFKNFIFFAPRRKVEIFIESAPNKLLKATSVHEFNSLLESWFNRFGSDGPTFVKHTWLDEIISIPTNDNIISNNYLNNKVIIDPVAEDKLYNYLSAKSGVELGLISYTSHLNHDLNFDSLMIAELMVWLDNEFAVEVTDMSLITTVNSVVTLIGSPQELPDKSNEEPTKNSNWKISHYQDLSVNQDHKNIANVVLARILKSPTNPIIADSRVGVINGKQFLLRSILLAKKFRNFTEARIGILLPATGTVPIIVQSLYLANKTPVFLNWTTGKRNINYALELSGIKTIITARSFFDKLPIDINFLEPKLVFLEDLRQQISLFDKITGKILASKNHLAISNYFKIEEDGDKEAVILFTSGSEAAPKGVILSHKNILSNIISAIKIIPITTNDSLLSFLPPFHSFGFTVGTILPLVTGLRTYYHPNPTEGKKLARAIAKWNITTIVGTPTFLSSVFEAGENTSFDSLKYILSGAEKAPNALFDFVSSINPKAHILEGYGITECSPIITVNQPNTNRCGVGKALSCVSIKIVHPESHEELTTGITGLVLVKGTSVFSNYLGNPRNPFLKMNNEDWYNTGDLGYLTEDGTLILAGRLKRFVKIAGEMISIPALEDAINKYLIVNNLPSNIIITAVGEGEERTKLILFTTSYLDLSTVNQIIRDAGFSNLCRVYTVETISEIPLLGSGKVDLATIAEMARVAISGN
jgi:long-chain-fatty-acid--[acyl-carrier-protein] ligase